MPLPPGTDTRGRNDVGPIVGPLKWVGPPGAQKTSARQGRYYLGNDAKFTSQEIKLTEERGSKGINPVTIFLVHWTVYNTDCVNNIVNTQTFPRTISTVEDKSSPLTGTVAVSIRDESLNDLVGSNLTNPDGTAPGESKQVSVKGAFRYQLLFQPAIRETSAVRPGEPPLITDTLIFDDITFYYYTAPKILSWKYER
ncbi:MAG: hypothetical protein QME51_10345 [Planctomycetota bacterium]|nr:hypothetical protein [Planctomycetota bacterium]